MAARDETLLLVDDVGPVRWLTLNRPEALNAFNASLLDAFDETLADPAVDDDVRVIVIRSG